MDINAALLLWNMLFLLNPNPIYLLSQYMFMLHIFNSTTVKVNFIIQLC